MIFVMQTDIEVFSIEMAVDQGDFLQDGHSFRRGAERSVAQVASELACYIYFRIVIETHSQLLSKKNRLLAIFFNNHSVQRGIIKEVITGVDLLPLVMHLKMQMRCRCDA